MERVFTFCLNADKASDETYQTWTTIRFIGSEYGTMERLSNAEGNGQTFKACGEWSYDNGVMNVYFHLDTIPNRIAAHCLILKGAKVQGARGYGVLYPKACTFNVTDSKVTAAPTLMGRNRDKNVNKEWDKQTAKFGKLPCHAGTDDETMMRNWNEILSRRAIERMERMTARKMGIPVAKLRSIKSL